MFELIVSVFAVVAMVKVASADDQSPLLWGLITFGLCALSFMLMPACRSSGSASHSLSRSSA